MGGWVMKKYLPSWMLWGVAGMVVTTGASAYTMTGMITDPEQFIKDLSSNKYNTWALRLMNKTIGLACGYDADREVMLLAKGVALAQKKVMAKFAILMDVGVEDTDPKKLSKEKMNELKAKKSKIQDELIDKLCPEVVEKLQRAKTNSSYVAAVVKLFVWLGTASASLAGKMGGMPGGMSFSLTEED